MTIHPNTILAAAALALASALSSTDAAARDVLHSTVTQPTGICQSALPVFDGQLRKRPVAVQNEGNAGAFVTCSWTMQLYAHDLWLYASSVDGTSSFITCTLVAGRGSDLVYLTKTYFLAASGVPTRLRWQGSELNPDFAIIGSYVSVSCSLAPGVALNDSEIFWYEYVAP